MKLTGNLEEAEEDETSKICIFGSCKPKWRPAGRLMVWDDAVEVKTPHQVFVRWEYYTCGNNGNGGPEDQDDTDENNNFYSSQCRGAIYRTEYSTTTGGYVPLEGAEVLARRWFTVHKGFSDAQGYYSCDGKFRNPANYSIKWERNDFSIRSGTVGQALYNGPKKTGNWNINIRENDIQEFYAMIFQGARYY
ncbi:MAG: hypothetical protein F4X93_06690, partial [Proteobacteria bacterium]|nr:hypothetical protein [Pseudomonadota bacterium]